MKNKLLKINGFQLSHLFVAQFYWMFWLAIKSIFTNQSYLMGNFKLRSFIEIGGSETPNKTLWDEGFTVSFCGYIFGKRIVHYYHDLHSSNSLFISLNGG